MDIILSNDAKERGADCLVISSMRYKLDILLYNCNLTKYDIAIVSMFRKFLTDIVDDVVGSNYDGREPKRVYHFDFDKTYEKEWMERLK